MNLSPQDDIREARQTHDFGASRGVLGPSATMKLSPQDDIAITIFEGLNYGG
jgi:hypothetical protein